MYIRIAIPDSVLILMKNRVYMIIDIFKQFNQRIQTTPAKLIAMQLEQHGTWMQCVQINSKTQFKEVSIQDFNCANLCFKSTVLKPIFQHRRTRYRAFMRQYLRCKSECSRQARTGVQHRWQIVTPSWKGRGRTTHRCFYLLKSMT